VIRAPRPLSDDEIEAVLALDVPARLATIDAEGFPHVTPLWFVWDNGAFHLTVPSSQKAHASNRSLCKSSRRTGCGAAGRGDPRQEGKPTQIAWRNATA
jgi:Pyridoxamine 5'-phosphate oxidase